jgi:hypothetical protein
MKHVKKYETHNIEPKVGDYVICYREIDMDSSDIYKILHRFINNNIGLIVSKYTGDTLYVVRYYDIPLEISGFFSHGGIFDDCINIFEHDMLYFSDNREELKLKFHTIKYNL